MLIFPHKSAYLTSVHRNCYNIRGERLQLTVISSYLWQCMGTSPRTSSWSSCLRWGCLAGRPVANQLQRWWKNKENFINYMVGVFALQLLLRWATTNIIISRLSRGGRWRLRLIILSQPRCVTPVRLVKWVVCWIAWNETVYRWMGLLVACAQFRVLRLWIC